MTSEQATARQARALRQRRWHLQQRLERKRDRKKRLADVAVWEAVMVLDR
jgi:hypothetical protein